MVTAIHHLPRYLSITRSLCLSNYLTSLPVLNFTESRQTSICQKQLINKNKLADSSNLNTAPLAVKAPLAVPAPLVVPALLAVPAPLTVPALLAVPAPLAVTAR